MRAVAGVSRRNRENTRERLNLGARFAYVDCAETAGPLRTPEDEQQPVRMRHVAHWSSRIVLTLLVLLSTGTGLLFVGWLLLPHHIPGAGQGPWAGWSIMVARVAFVLMVTVEIVRLIQNITVWIFAYFAKDPIPMDPPIALRVALLTTIVPSREPIEVVARTLRRMKDIVYCGHVDVWILDEGDDPDVKKMAAELGVRHFSRKGIPEYNQESGQFRARMKSGNHNSWRAQHEDDYDVVVNLDPDHVPLPNFLERTLGYFRDPDVAFVVAPQVYGNMYENWVVHGASAQQYVFNGIIERAGNGLDAPMLIGTNHLYRPEPWRQIGGYQDSIIEDHLTSMRVQATDNPATGNRWKGIYTPDVVAIGEGPASWADYFSQQTRWATGIWEILLSRKRGMPRELKFRQRFFYGLLQFYYPSVGFSLFLSNVATAVYMFFGQGAMKQAPPETWLTLWALSLGSWFCLWFFLRRYNIAEHEREEVGMLGMALSLFAGPVYLSAAVSAILRRPLTFKVTPKGHMRSAESIGTFRLHLLWAVVGGAMLGASFWLHHDHAALRIWSGLTVFTGIAPPVIALCSGVRAWWRRRGTVEEPVVVPELDEAGREIGPGGPGAEPVFEVPAVPVRGTAFIPQQRRAPDLATIVPLGGAPGSSPGDQPDAAPASADFSASSALSASEDPVDSEVTQRVPEPAPAEETQRVPAAVFEAAALAVSGPVATDPAAPEPVLRSASQPEAVLRGGSRPEAGWPSAGRPEAGSRGAGQPEVRLSGERESPVRSTWFESAPRPPVEPEDATQEMPRVADAITAVLPAVRLRAPVPPPGPEDDAEPTVGGWFSATPQPTGSGTGATP
ncbi:hypothetical protein Val02_75400 [Virgisporangium aliadipatigenens]|uniref:Glycosyltransferase 2-like domain-containing protein n=1 Tax=Virgisporangium aliadipatigenens TaxID=741659 RepID=A0A8J3YS22_9ACTN|nr:glycosyltransferase family 2 protein [Virgisporangium aliadipatigenens]GIJ50654.1 hypothetical protein Val02_75400 [Virgisporangium aliadipatigenens]